MQLSVIEHFKSIVRKYPGHFAVVCDGENELTYRELEDWALDIATRLKTLGVGRECIVGICVEKSSEYIASLLGVWYAGAAFLPIDPKLPSERIEFILEDSQLSVVLGQASARNVIKKNGIQFLNPAKQDIRVNREFCPDLKPYDLAYVIFTSGSTGRPKGVMVEHRGIVNLLQAQIQAFQLDSHSRSLFYLSTSFDASVSDICTSLLSGATLYIERPDLLQPGPEFLELLRKREISYLDFPPSMMQLLNPEDMPSSLKTIVIGGEACSPEVVRRWAQRFRIINVYGPTETTVCTSLCVCDPETWDKPLIGTPLPNIDYHLLDRNLTPVEKGIPGELFISGVCLARGYLNRPELTHEKFITLNGVRMYRTHDKIIEVGNGQIQFIGRTDRQFKLRGLLIEPAEIELRILECSGVAQAAVVKRKVEKDSAREILVAFIVRTGETEISAKQLRTQIGEHLPKWMIPQRFEFLGALPMTLTSKVDFSKLTSIPLRPAPVEKTENSESGSSSPLAELLIDIWKQVLKVDFMTVEDHFFDLGGDSLAVLEVVAVAGARGLNISPSLMIFHPTIALLATALEKETNSDEMSCEDLRKEIQLNEEWTRTLVAAQKRPEPTPQPIQTFFLTGATGFLGSQLLDELLQLTQAKIYCLVRGQKNSKDTSCGYESIRAALKTHGKTLASNHVQRVIPVCGDLSQDCFGLDPSVWNEIVIEVDTVYHCAAHVNMLLPYDKLKGSNVKGTWEIIRLLCEGRKKSLHYASTLSVFVATDQNHGRLLEEDDLRQTSKVYGGYAQTKWASEVLLRSLEGAAGPISYYRFGLITGDTQTGYSSPRDFLSLFVRGLTSLGYVPSERADAAIDITPIDYAAKALAHLSLREHTGGTTRTYHIANPKSLFLNDLIAIMRNVGICLKEVSSQEFRFRLIESSKDCPNAAESAASLALCRCLAIGSEESGKGSFENVRTMDLFQATGVIFDMRNTQEGLEGTELKCPEPSSSLIQLYLTQILSQTRKP